MSVRVMHGDCLQLLPTLDADSVHAVVTDPPYELGFMGRAWDKSGIAFSPQTWRQIYRVLKPGGYLAAFGAPRNSHRMTCAIEDAGFEIRDSIARLHDGGLDGPLLWVFGSGFPKSHDVSKAIDKAAGAVREVTRSGVKVTAGYGDDWDANTSADRERRDTPATPEAAQWSGWGSALKPAYEPIILARKPLRGGIAANVLRHGCGGINIDACRVPTDDNTSRISNAGTNGAGWGMGSAAHVNGGHDAGRFPANVCHDGSDEVMAAFAAFGNAPGQSGAVTGNEPSTTTRNTFGLYNVRVTAVPRGDTGSSARFFYSAKADTDDRCGSKHPTIKPLALMQWLVRLITPPGGTVLDPFAGSGTTLLAADRQQFNAIGIEQEAEYVADIHRRLQSDAPLFAEVL